MSPLSNSIKNTLAYFSLFNYPLTKEEIFAYLWQPPRIGFEEFIESVKAENRELMQAKYGYYFFDNGASDESRRRRLVISENKMKIAARAVKKIRSVPFLRAVFVCNSVGLGTARKESDIDFFIVSSPRRIWLVRFFTNLILRLTGLRTYGKKSENKICLSFYVDEDSLNLSSLCALEPDIHFIYWIHQMIPLYDPDNFYDKFLSQNNWTLNFLPNVMRISGSSYLRKINNSKFGLFWKKLWEKMWSGLYGDLIEKQTRGIQMQRFKDSIKQAADRSDNSVVLSDNVLKFHENDRRREVFEKWKEIIQEN